MEALSGNINSLEKSNKSEVKVKEAKVHITFKNKDVPLNRS